jgi:predicted  nucleic acid-binding Zn-ribbon protein
MSTKIERLEQANALLSRELREKESEVKRLSVRSTLDKDFKKAQTLDSKLRDAQRNLEDFESELVVQRDKANKLQYEVDILRNVVQLRDHPELLRVADAEVRSRKMEQELRLVKEELIATSEKCKVYYEGCTKAAKEADALRYKCSRLQDDLDRQSRDMKDLLVEREGYLRAVQEADENRTELHEQLDALEDAHDRRSSTIRELEETISTLQHELKELRVDEENARSTWDEGHRLLEHTLAQLKECQQERDQLRVKMQHLEEEDHTNQRRSESLHRTMEALRSENKQMRNQLATWQSRADEIDQMGRRLAVADADEAKKQHRISTLEEECSSLRLRLGERERECQGLSHELDSVKEDLAVQTEQMNVLSRNLMSRLERVESERDAALESCEKFDHDLRVTQEKLSTLSVLMTHHQSLNRTALASSSAGGVSSASNSIATPTAGGATNARLQRLLGGEHGGTQGGQQAAERRGRSPITTSPIDLTAKSMLASGSSSASRPDSRHTSPPRTTHNNTASEVALSPPTPLPSASERASQSLRSRLERLTR